MAGIANQRISERLSSARFSEVKTAEIQTAQGLRTARISIESNFGLLKFQIDKPRNGRPERFCYLTEDQSYFILTLSRNTERVMDAKAALVKAFSRLRQEQVKPQLALPQTYLEAID